MARFSTPRILDVALVAVLVSVAVFAVHPPIRTPAPPPESLLWQSPAAAAAADPARARDPLAGSRPLVVPDTAPADWRLRRELRRLAGAQRWYRQTKGRYTADALPDGYLAPPGVTLTLDIDTTVWWASAWDADAARQCAVRLGGDDDDVPFVPLPEGEVRCRRLPRPDPRHTSFAGWAGTTVWVGGAGTRRLARAGPLAKVRAMQFVLQADLDDGFTTYALRGGLGVAPEPDPAGPPLREARGTELLLRDVMWGDFYQDGQLEALVRVVENQGGTAFDNYLALVWDEGGRLVNGPVEGIGDGTKLLRLSELDGVITADLVVRGEDEGDGRCCSTDTVRARYEADDDSLVELSWEPWRGLPPQVAGAGSRGWLGGHGAAALRPAGGAGRGAWSRRTRLARVLPGALGQIPSRVRMSCGSPALFSMSRSNLARM